jgi:hypothetical protein
MTNECSGKVAERNATAAGITEDDVELYAHQASINSWRATSSSGIVDMLVWISALLLTLSSLVVALYRGEL